LSRLQQFISELKRRRVIRTLIGWGIFSFAVLQVVEPVLHAYHLPDGLLTVVVTVLAAGFPAAVVLAWVFDITARGIVRTGPPPGAGGLAPSGPRLAMLLLGLGLLAAAPGLAYFHLRPGAGGRPAEGTGPATAAPSIAVLPFVNLSSDKEQEYFSDGIAEEILNALAQVDGLRVVGRTSSFAFKGKSEDLAGIAQKLHATSILEGSVRKDGNRVRITAQLINAADGYHLWSQTFDRELTGTFAVQDEIAEAVVEALKVKLLPGVRPTAGEGHSTNAEAFNHFLLGREFRRRGTAKQVYERARVELESALRIDPAYAPAWAELAHVLFSLADDAGGAAAVTDAKHRARAAVERAVALDPTLPDALVERARMRETEEWDWNGARADAGRALALAPGYARAKRRYGWLLAQTGRPVDGVPYLTKAIELDPLDSANWITLGNMYLSSGRTAEARAAFERALELAPESTYSPFLLGLTYLVSGEPAPALALFEKNKGSTWRLTGVAIARHDLGQGLESEKALQELVTTEADSSAYQIAQVHAWRGEKDVAFAWLDRAYAQRDAGLAELRVDPLLRRIRDDPRYAALLRKVNLPAD